MKVTGMRINNKQVKEQKPENTQPAFNSGALGVMWLCEENERE